MTARTYDAAENVELTGPAAEYIRKEMAGIGGWLSKHEAAIFSFINEVQQSSCVGGDLVDLGVWHGRSALLLYQFLESNERLYAVDIFDLRSRSHRYFNDPNIFLGHCKRLRVDERLEVVKMDTTQDGERLAAKLGSKSCRIVHVDGGHDYRTAKMDMELGASVLVDGGVLVCDDVFLRGFPGVTQALVELLQKKGDLVPIAISTKKIWITTSAYAQRYREYLKARCVGAKFKTASFMGTGVLIMV